MGRYSNAAWYYQTSVHKYQTETLEVYTKRDCCGHLVCSSLPYMESSKLEVIQRIKCTYIDGGDSDQERTS